MWLVPLALRLSGARWAQFRLTSQVGPFCLAGSVPIWGCPLQADVSSLMDVVRQKTQHLAKQREDTKESVASTEQRFTVLCQVCFSCVLFGMPGICQYSLTKGGQGRSGPARDELGIRVPNPQSP